MNIDKEEVEIDLLELGKKLWDNKKFIIKCSIVGAIIGVVIAFSIPKEYTTTVILTTESGKPKGGSMGPLASMAGINLGASMRDDILSPELYPEVLKSTPFIQGLLDIKVIDETQDINVSLYNYLKDEQKGAWWSHVLKLPGSLISLLSSETEDNNEGKGGNENLRFISKKEMIIIENARNSFLINTDKKNGITSIEVTLQSRKISAFIADTLTSYLQKYIIEERTKKAKTDLANSESLYEQAKSNYYTAQQKLASYTDANMNVISAKHKINQEKLQNEAVIAHSVYNQMAQQVQVNKIKVQDDTPMFTVIQPAIEPIYPSKPSKKLILIAFIFISVSGASIWTLKDKLSAFFQTKNN